MNLFKNLNKKFDKVFLLTLSSRKDRLAGALNMLKNIGLENISDITIQYATEFPYNDIIADVFNKSGKGRFTKPNEYDCSRNHYSMIKQAYDDSNCNSILIMEDDIQFVKDLDLFNEYLDSIPEDFDIIQFGGFSGDCNIIKYLDQPEKWVKHPDVGLWTTSMYALSRRGMNFYLSFMNKLFWVADGPLYKAPINDKLVSTYMPNIPLVIQVDKNIVSSDIRDESNDKINYNNDNLYESHINKNNYFTYRQD